MNQGELVNEGAELTSGPQLVPPGQAERIAVVVSPHSGPPWTKRSMGLLFNSLNSTMRKQVLYSPHFTEKKTEAQRTGLGCLGAGDEGPV